VVEHCSPSNHKGFDGLSPLGTAWIASGGMFMPSARTVWTVVIFLLGIAKVQSQAAAIKIKSISTTEHQTQV
jgi:hypothetical protein